jgi:methyltransferase-like protein
VEKFHTPSGLTLSTPQPICKAALTVLAERWPVTIPFADLCIEARARLEAGPEARPDPLTAEQDRELVGAEMLKCFAATIVELRAAPSRFATNISARPRANSLARLEAAKGPRVTSLRHEAVPLDEFAGELLKHLDGQHDRLALLDILAKLVSDGVLKVEKDGQTVTDAAAIRGVLKQVLKDNLAMLARAALLEA